MKKCSKCGQVKKKEEFPRTGTKCKNCRRDADWQRRYGLTPEEYLAIYNKQDGACAICGELPGNSPLVVDHCHNSKKVRGLLCLKCNRGLGFFSDDPNLLRKAAMYLEDSNESS